MLQHKQSGGQITVALAPSDFTHWQDVLALLQDAFAFMEGRIDPPSSLHQLDVDALKEKFRTETGILAWENETLIGCAFLKPERDHLYLNKIAVALKARGKGIARRLVALAQQEARRRALPRLQLITRIELTENHATFRALGFHQSGQGMHPGFDLPTEVVFEKDVVRHEI